MPISYEQAANEEIRACLRIEQLFLQIEKYKTADTTLNHRNMVSNIVGILNIIDRPDIKIKLLKRFDQQISSLQNHARSPNVDLELIQDLLATLNKTKNQLLMHQGKLCESMREHELLKQLSYHLTNIGSGFSFDAPAFHYWISQPTASRLQAINDWLLNLDFIKTMTQDLLSITRQNMIVTSENTSNGFFQKNLSGHQDYQLFTVELPTAVKAYPKISIGKQFINVHFYEVEADGRMSAAYTELIDFQLVCCAVLKNSFDRTV